MPRRRRKDNSNASFPCTNGTCDSVFHRSDVLKRHMTTPGQCRQMPKAEWDKLQKTCDLCDQVFMTVKLKLTHQRTKRKYCQKQQERKRNNEPTFPYLYRKYYLMYYLYGRGAPRGGYDPTDVSRCARPIHMALVFHII